MSIIIGTNSSEPLFGGRQNDVIFGRGGSDTNVGFDAGVHPYERLEFDGNDRVLTLDGDDVILTGFGNDVIIAGNGNNRINADTIDPSDPINIVDDSVGGNDLVIAGSGNDLVGTFGGRDFVSAGAGNDTVEAGDGDDFINAGHGDDEVGGGRGRDIVFGGPGNDELNAGEGNDFVHGGPGDDTIKGGSDDDHIIDGKGRDLVEGRAGNDRIFLSSDKLTDDVGFRLGDDGKPEPGFDQIYGFYTSLPPAISDLDNPQDARGNPGGDRLYLERLDLDRLEQVILERVPHGTKVSVDLTGGQPDDAIPLVLLVGVLPGDMTTADGLIDGDIVLI